MTKYANRHSEAYRQGYKLGRDEYRHRRELQCVETTNPYVPNTQEHVDWSAGYDMGGWDEAGDQIMIDMGR